MLAAIDRAEEMEETVLAGSPGLLTWHNSKARWRCGGRKQLHRAGDRARIRGGGRVRHRRHENSSANASRPRSALALASGATFRGFPDVSVMMKRRPAL